jgi:hypothetical protein
VRLISWIWPAVLMVASCSGGHRSADRAASSQVHSKPGATLVVFAPTSTSNVTATEVVLGDSTRPTGHVLNVDRHGEHGSRIRIAIEQATTLHANAEALVCSNLIRIDPGSQTMPALQDLVITLDHTRIKPGRC